MQLEDLQEIINRCRACPELKPYATAKGGVVVLNGPFPEHRAKCAVDFVKHARNDIWLLTEEVRRLQTKLDQWEAAQ